MSTRRLPTRTTVVCPVPGRLSDERSLLLAVFARPDDDTPRLAYADWLDEHAGLTACRQIHCRTGWVSDLVGRAFGGEVTDPRHPLHNPDGRLPYYDKRDRRYKCPVCDRAGRVPDGRAARAELIRLQCLPDPQWPGRTARLEELLAAHAGVWVGAGWQLACDHTRLWLRRESAGDAVVFERGFAASYTGRLEVFAGGHCSWCGGTGVRGDDSSCRACTGGRFEAVAPTLFAGHPVRDVTTCRHVSDEPTHPVAWFACRPTPGLQDDWNSLRLPPLVDGLPRLSQFSNWLPAHIAAHLPGPPSRTESGRIWPGRLRDIDYWDYPNRDAAHAAVGRAYLSYGRSVAAGWDHRVRCVACGGEGVRRWACATCFAWADADGIVHHSPKCFEFSSRGGGSQPVSPDALPLPCPACDGCGFVDVPGLPPWEGAS